VALLYLQVYGWPHAPTLAVKVSQGKTFTKPLLHYTTAYPFWDAVAWALMAVDTPCAERQGYESVLEHVVVQFVAKCSRICTHELVRHRLASYAQTSTRILGVTGFRHDDSSAGTLYPLVVKAAEGEKEALETLCVIPPGDDGSVREACLRYFRAVIGSRGLNVDQWVRYQQPDALAAHIMVTTNLREVLHIAELRLHPHAHWEIRQLVEELMVALWREHMIPVRTMLVLKRPGLLRAKTKLWEGVREELDEVKKHVSYSTWLKLCSLIRQAASSSAQGREEVLAGIGCSSSPQG